MVENFGIQYGEEFLDVEEGQMLTVEWVSSFFNENNIFAGSYTYPVLLSYTDKNKAILQHGQLLENRSSRRRVPVNIQLFGQSWKRGEMSYDVTPRGFEATITIDVGVVAEWMRERTIASVFTITNNGKFVKYIDLPGRGTETANKAMVRDSQISAPGEMPFVFAPLRNDMATGEMIGDETAPYPMWLVNPNVHSANDYTGDGTLWTPFFYLHWVIREVCDFLGFTAMGSFMDDPEVARWVVYNNGIFHSDEFKKTTFAIQPAKHLPMVSISDFLKILRGDYQVRIYFDSQTREAHFIHANDLLQTPSTVDLSGALIADTLQIKHNPVRGYELTTKIDDSDEIFSIFPYTRAFTIGLSDTPKTHELRSALTWMYHGPLSGGRIIRCPWVRQQPNLYGTRFQDNPAYNPEGTYGKNSFGFRVLAYRGVVNNTETFTGNMFPYLTSDIKNGNGVDEYSASVSPGGDEGYLNRYCVDWYNMLCASEQLDFRAKIGMRHFLNMSPLQRVIVSTESLARTAILLDRVTFEPSVHSDTIQARILCYALYNMMAISEQIQTAFEGGEVIVPEFKVYARLNVEGEYWYVNKSREKEKRADLYVSFYRDAAGTIPYSVTEMYVQYEETEVSAKAGVSTRVLPPSPLKVSGQKIKIATETTYRWVKSDLWNAWTGTNREYMFRLVEVGNSYVVI